MFEGLNIQSHCGPYRVDFAEIGTEFAQWPEGHHVIIDDNVAALHAERLAPLLAGPSVLRVEAIEANKSLEAFPRYVQHLVAAGLRRDHTLLAIGGGIIQDITCFLSATMLRGVPWRFIPTTLLAQADSCIGSKSSVNCQGAKNILGTFTPPRQVTIDDAFLGTLSESDMRSGIGEILKVHAIAGADAFDTVAQPDRLLHDRPLLMTSIRNALLIKQGYIETDEFDRGPRLVFNYGHSFGHAIEAATDFGVPHGIAVTLGMDMANWISWQLGRNDGAPYRRMHQALAANYAPFAAYPVPVVPLIAALAKDKKNTGTGAATLILPDQNGALERVRVLLDERMAGLVEAFLATRSKV